MTDQQRLICGAREHPDGSILVPFPLAGPDESDLCENPARYRVGTAETYLEEHLTNDPDTLALLTEEHERAQNALLCCGVHKARAKETWQRRERAPDSTEYPTVEELNR
ncbi:MAG TPA: hypothetical protein VFJ06_06630 [Halococcus sp.]|nr:hypothetical protein [Halococcus sp.]